MATISMTSGGYREHGPGLSLSVTSSAERNFGLTKAEFQRLAVELRDGDERLFESIFLKNFEQCRLYLINKDKAQPEDAYDAVMHALLHLRDLIIQDKVHYGNIRYLLCLMARQSYRRELTANSKYTELPSLTDIVEEQNVAIDEEDLQKLQRGLSSLGQSCRELLIANFHLRRTLKSLAEETGRTAAAVRQQKGRCLKQLRQYFLQSS